MSTVKTGANWERDRAKQRTRPKKAMTNADQFELQLLTFTNTSFHVIQPDVEEQDMPPRVLLSSHISSRGLASQYVCRACMLKAVNSQAVRQTRIKGRRRLSSAGPFQERSSEVSTRRARADARSREVRRSTQRFASNGSLASVSAINAPTSVPHEYRELHQRLVALQEKASSYVDLSRLQLATRSLESSSPVVRVALLGLGTDGALAARKLARVLLADALGSEEAWEKAILASEQSGKPLLLRYGDEDEAVQSSPLVQTMNVPSPFLQRNNLELLIATLNTNGSSENPLDQAAIEETILVPALTTPNSAGGRSGFVRYPVHKAVVVAEGITGAVRYGRFPASIADGSLITAALGVPLRRASGEKTAEQEATGNAVDIDLATHALDIFRLSKANGAQFSDEWQTSRVAAISEWIAPSKDREAYAGLNPAVQNLIPSLLSSTSASISQLETAETSTATSASIPDTKRTTLQSAITTWSADAHRDLQMNLDTAFATSPSWRRTAWWRLFWRIDDVTLSASDVLRQSWLTEAEQSLAFLSGRISEAGLATEAELRGPSPALLEEGRGKEMETYDRKKAETETAAELLQLPSMLSKMQQQSGVNALFNPPWPQTINLSRQFMLRTLVPGLHSKAQSLLVTCLTTIGGSAALAAWFYVATAGIALYESGAIVSLGLVWGLRRLQKRWSIEREGFAVKVREDARSILGEVEGQLRRVAQDGGRVTLRPEDVREWREAREAVKGCEEALKSLQRSQ